MNRSFKPNLYVALIHYPVVNKNGEVISSAVTNLDLHDISRAAGTYGVEAFYVVTPLADQKILVEKIVSHWQKGAGSIYNPDRRKALELIRIKDSLEEVSADIRDNGGKRPIIVATSAREYDSGIGCGLLREMLSTRDEPCLLIFGTAWGLTRNLIENSDYILKPVKGNTDYNHLSVRSAASVILDRLLGIDD